MKNVTVKGYPFVNHVEQIEKENNFDLKMILDHKGYHGSQDNLMRLGGIKLMGYFYDCRQYLKKYIVKTVYGDIIEYYALNKTNARKLAHCRVMWIKEI